jgi:hypothetical protein
MILKGLRYEEALRLCKSRLHDMILKDLLYEKELGLFIKLSEKKDFDAVD